jgi:hypothetical protein
MPAHCLIRYHVRNMIGPWFRSLFLPRSVWDTTSTGIYSCKNVSHLKQYNVYVPVRTLATWKVTRLRTYFTHHTFRDMKCDVILCWRRRFMAPLHSTAVQGTAVSSSALTALLTVLANYYILHDPITHIYSVSVCECLYVSYLIIVGSLDYYRHQNIYVYT